MKPHRRNSRSDQPLAVLLVGDNPRERVRLGRLLRRQFGRRVTIREAQAGREALDMLRTQPVDVALVDEQLPDMEGAEVVDQVARSADGTAAILLAGQANEPAPADGVPKQRLDGPALAEAVNQALDSHRLAKQNAKMAEQLARTQAQMDHFLKAISHDMGANFMVMEHSLRELKRSCGDAALPAAVEAASHVEACLRESQRFLADLAQLSTSGTVSMTPERVELGPLVEAVLFEQKDLIASRGAAVEVAGPLPAVWCNATRARQVFTNLVRNALKHGCDPRQPRLRIAAVAPPVGQDRAGHVWLAVEDNGPGIPARHRDEIFLPAKRLAGAAAEGSGMGLAIVRKIIDHHGGTIFVDPDCQAGARFVFSLPAAPAMQAR